MSHSFSLAFATHTVMQKPSLFGRFEADRDRGEFGALPELHALSSGLKAVCTWITADGIEECRWGAFAHTPQLITVCFNC